MIMQGVPSGVGVALGESLALFGETPCHPSRTAYTVKSKSSALHMYMYIYIYIQIYAYVYKYEYRIIVRT